MLVKDGQIRRIYVYWTPALTAAAMERKLSGRVDSFGESDPPPCFSLMNSCCIYFPDAKHEQDDKQLDLNSGLQSHPLYFYGSHFSLLRRKEGGGGRGGEGGNGD